MMDEYLHPMENYTTYSISRFHVVIMENCWILSKERLVIVLSHGHWEINAILYNRMPGKLRDSESTPVVAYSGTSEYCPLGVIDYDKADYRQVSNIRRSLVGN